MNNTKTVFISGKINGLPLNTAKALFKSAEQLLKCAGYTDIFNPIEQIAQYIPYEFQMVKCFEEINTRDKVYQLDNWIDSPGARRECSYALSLEKEIINEKSVLYDIKNIDRGCSVLDNTRTKENK